MRALNEQMSGAVCVWLAGRAYTQHTSYVIAVIEYLIYSKLFVRRNF